MKIKILKIFNLFEILIKILATTYTYLFKLHLFFM